MSMTSTSKAAARSIVPEHADLPDNARVSGTELLARKRMEGPRICCVLPAYNEAENLAELVPSLCEQLEQLSTEYEVLIVDDGSRDRTAETVVRLAEEHPLRLLQLARNFGKEHALTAGIDHARGDLLILMDADFQHPLELLPRFYELWRQGFDMVYGIRADRRDESALKQRFTRWFYRFMARGSAAVKIEPDAGDFRLFDYSVVKALQSLPERTRFMKGLYSWVGFRTIGIPYRVEERRAGQSGFNFWRLAELAVTGITSFTSLPLRFCSAFGALVSLFSMIYGGYVVVRTLLFGVDLPGWATLVAGISFLSGIQLLSIGILGEYIARVFVEVKQRPTYLVGRYHEAAALRGGVEDNDTTVVPLRADRDQCSAGALADGRSAGSVGD